MEINGKPFSSREPSNDFEEGQLVEVKYGREKAIRQGTIVDQDSCMDRGSRLYFQRWGVLFPGEEKPKYIYTEEITKI